MTLDWCMLGLMYALGFLVVKIGNWLDLPPARK
jgi:hypothetical protein